MPRFGPSVRAQRGFRGQFQDRAPRRLQRPDEGVATLSHRGPAGAGGATQNSRRVHYRRRYS